MTTGIAWPTREEWAKGQRTIYLGDECPPQYFEPYAHLVTPEMTAAARAELEALWKALLKVMRGHQAEQAYALLCAGTISREEFDARSDTSADTARWVRQEIRENQKYEQWKVPTSYDDLIEKLPEIGRAHPLTAVRRYQEAYTAQERSAYADWEHAVRNRVLDDDAWEQELQRRATRERYLNDPASRFSR